MTALGCANLNQLPCPGGRWLAKAAVEALIEEAAVFPKPGLVSPIGCGAHRDMHYGHFVASAFALQPGFLRIAALGEGKGIAIGFERDLVPEGLRMEREMLAATGGVNTHRGAIFVLGLLVAAAAVSGTREANCLQESIVRLWGDELARHPGRGGGDSRGAISEARSGFRSVFQLALPHFSSLMSGGQPRSLAAIETLLLLIANADDSNLARRGGAAGAAWARRSASGFLRRGGVRRDGWIHDLTAMHGEFIWRGLSPGGCADLLAATIWVDGLAAGSEGNEGEKGEGEFL